MQIVTPAQAVAGIGSGDQVYVHCAAAAPSVLLDALVARAPELEAVGVDQFNVYLMNGDEEEMLEIYGRDIIPALADVEARTGT